MKTDNFDTLLAGIREEAVDPALVDAAASRVRGRLFAGQPSSGTPASTDRLRNCADFQALIPAYLNRTLGAGKSMLLVDHTHACVECRRALDTARSGKVQVLRRPQAVSAQVSPVTRWAAAAVIMIAAGAATFAMVRSMIVPAGARASVQSVYGTLYEVSNGHNGPVFAGRELGERQVVRTSRDSTALLRLADGSTVELNGRTQVAFTRASRGTTILLDRGNIIVHAAKQHDGALYVKTADSQVMVKGTIFAVAQGTKGSRVSVVEGSVKVDEGSKSVLLKPGEQTTSNPTVEQTSIQDEVAWSRESAKYLAMLGELSGFQKDLEKIPAANVRTSSKLLDMAPPTTVVYAAIPNIGNTLAEANRMFQDRMQSSPVLQQWWSEQGPQVAQLQTLIDKLQRAGTYLGDEVVLALAQGPDGRSQPILLAEVKQPGLKEYLQAEFAGVNAKSGRQTMSVIDDPLHATTAAQDRSAKVYVGDGMVALTQDTELLRDLAVRLTPNSGATSFADTSFHDRIQQSYQTGAAYLFCADLSQMAPRNGSSHQRATLRGTGLNGVQYLILERKEVSGQTKNQATFTFNGNRQGLASWLAAPGPMSTLDFVSPEASLATSFVIQNPGALLTQLLAQAEAKDPQLQQHINDFQNQTGINITSDIANSLGGELTFAIDGPLLPTPSWKLAVEVYSPDRLEYSIEHLVTAFNQQPNTPTKLVWTKSVEGSNTFYKIVPQGGQAAATGAEIDYVFVDGYFLAAANRALLNTALQNRSTGYTLARSENFRKVLPQDANSNFSAIVYHNVGGLVGPLVENLKAMNAVSPEQKQAMAALQANSAPGLIYAYGEPDRIVVAANGSLFGFNLDSLALPNVLQNLTRLKQKQ